MEYPCGICGSEVRDGQKAIFCDGVCLLWYHAQCVDMTIEEYEYFTCSDAKWECIACKNKDLPDLNSIDAVDLFHFDFQQNLPTPKLAVGEQFYLRLLWTYLFGIYSASTQLTAAFMWHKMIAKRGSNDVLTNRR